MKIREKIIVALLIVGIAPILVSLAISAFLMISRSSQDVKQSLTKNLEKFKNEIYLDMDRHQTYASFFSRNIQIQDLGSKPEVRIQFLMTSLPFDIRLLEISHKDKILKREFKSTSEAKFITDKKESAYIWNILSRPLYHRYFTMSFPQASQQTLVIRNTAIITDPDTDQKTGLVILSLIIDENYLSKLTSNYPNTILFCEINGKISFSQVLNQEKVNPYILSLSNNTISKIKISKKGHFYIYKNSLLKLKDGSFAKLGVLHNINQLNKVVNLFKQTALIVFFLNVLMAILISVFLSKKISVPIINLTDEVILFKDHFKPVSSVQHPHDEIGILHQAFSEMSKKILDYRETIEQYNNQLTDEVTEKTHDLLSKIRGLSLMNELSSFLIKDENIDESQLIKKISREIKRLLKLKYIAVLSFKNEQWECVAEEYQKNQFKNSTETEKLAEVRVQFSEKVFKKGSPFIRSFKEESYLCYPIYFVDQVVYSLFVVIEKRKKEFFHEISDILVNMISMKIFSMRLNQDKRQAEKLASLGQFAGTIIHDIKNPLTVIKSYVEVLVDDDFSIEEKLDYKERLLTEIDRLTDMLNEILDYSKGKIELQKEETDLDAFLTKIVEFYHRSFKEKNIQFNLELNSHISIPLDQNRIWRSFANIINNAIAALPVDGTLTIRTEKKPYNALVIIKDNGIGIPKALQDKIFTPFVTHGKKGGTGLGLSIAKRIIESHGGSIAFKSATGKGTTFYIYFPL